MQTSNDDCERAGSAHDRPASRSKPRDSQRGDQQGDQPRSVLNSLDTQRADLVGDWMKTRLPNHENLPSQSVSWWDPGLATVCSQSVRKPCPQSLTLGELNSYASTFP